MQVKGVWAGKSCPRSAVTTNLYENNDYRKMKGLEGNHNLIIISEISEIKMADSNFIFIWKTWTIRGWRDKLHCWASQLYLGRHWSRRLAPAHVPEDSKGWRPKPWTVMTVFVFVCSGGFSVRVRHVSVWLTLWITDRLWASFADGAASSARCAASIRGTKLITGGAAFFFTQKWSRLAVMQQCWR